MKKRIFHLLCTLLACFLLLSARAQCIMGALSKDLLDPNTSQAFKDFIKGNPEGMMAYGKYLVNPYLRKDVEVLTATASFITNHPDYLANFPGKFDNILDNLKRAGARCNTCPPGGNKGIPTMHQAISDLDWAWATFKEGNVDVHKLFTEMAASYQKADGGSYMLSVLRTNAMQDRNYVSQIKSFEYQFLEDGRFEADLVRTINGVDYLSEFKSWKSDTWAGFSTTQKYVNQFKAYVRSGDKIEYIANVSKMTDKLNPLEYVRQQFAKTIKDNAKELFTSNPAFFQNISYNGAEITITNFQQLINYCEKADFVNSSLFNFVKAL